MAYEKSWQFLAPQGPRIAASVNDAYAYRVWLLKSFLKGEVGGATEGLWTCYGSCDGTTYSLNDGNDRWGTSFNLSKIPYGSNTGGARGWIILTRTFGSTQVWFTMSVGGGANATTGAFFFSGSAPTGGNLTTNPTAGVILGGDATATLMENLISDTTNGRKYYGALSTDGGWWFGETMSGEIPLFAMFQVPVGAKSNDQWPFFCRWMPTSSGYGLYAASSNHLYNMNSGTVPTVVGKFYNGSAGRMMLIQPYSTICATDAADVSLFDFPAWVIVGNADTPTQVHSRGRLADHGLNSGYMVGAGASAQRPVNLGTTIKDAGGNILYATFNQLIVPYNALVS